MQGYGEAKANKVVFLSFFPVALFGTAFIWSANRLLNLDSYVAIFAIYAIVLAVAGLIVRAIALRILFDKSNKSDFFALCGARKAVSGAMQNSATWPFAKVSATKTTLRFESPWNDCKWSNNGVHPTIRRTKKSSGEFAIYSEINAAEPAVIFSVYPWSVRGVEAGLRSLGYNVISEA